MYVCVICVRGYISKHVQMHKVFSIYKLMIKHLFHFLPLTNFECVDMLMDREETDIVNLRLKYLLNSRN